MSKERMNDLLAALREEGWRLLDPEDYPDGSRDPFKLEGDSTITWGVVHQDDSRVVKLGDLGRFTSNLRDILFCRVDGGEPELVFVKRQKPEWREKRLAFVRSLRKVVES